jgi:pimeloyl-ACP methyl ester carboxylesterase
VEGSSRLDVAGFSFGGVIAGIVAANLGKRTRSVTLVGTGGLGPPNRSVELIRVRHKIGKERLAAHRENLLRMMLAEPGSVDAMALEIQEQNAARTRLNSGFMWISSVLHEALPRVPAHVHAFWGEHEMTDQGLLETRIGLLQRTRPDAEITIMPGSGHWAFYESAEAFNSKFLRILEH